MATKRKYELISDNTYDLVELIVILLNRYINVSDIEKFEMIADDVYKSGYNMFDSKEECLVCIQRLQEIIG